MTVVIMMLFQSKSHAPYRRNEVVIGHATAEKVMVHLNYSHSHCLYQTTNLQQTYPPLTQQSGLCDVDAD